MKIARKKTDTKMLVAQEREHILSQDTDFFIRESYNTLRSNVTFSLTEKGCKIVAVTSTNPGEGKSITALNTAVAYAEINKRVLLIDCDLRKPKVHRLLAVKPTPGLSNILIDESEPWEAIQTIDKYGIDVIASGDIPPNSTQLLESEHLDALLDYVKERYDFVILDTPPINIVIDACILAKHTSGIIYVIKQNYAKKDHILNAVRQLEFSQGKIIGFVLNNITDKGILTLAGGKYGNNRYAHYKYENAANDEKEAESDAEQAGAAIEKKSAADKKGNTTPAGSLNEKLKLMKKKRRNAKKKNTDAANGGATKAKRRKRLIIVLAAVLAVIGGSVLAIAKYQENNIQALNYASQYSQAELRMKNEELDSKIQNVVSELPDVYIQPLNDEERNRLRSGELSEYEAKAIITGTWRAQTDDETEENDESGELETAPVRRVSRTNELVAEFYLLKAEFLNDIDNLIAQGQAERLAIPKEERDLSVKLEMAKKYAKLGSELEKECDAKVDELIKELEAELKSSGQSTSVISEIKELYKEEKSLKKAALIESYYPKG